MNLFSFYRLIVLLTGYYLTLAQYSWYTEKVGFVGPQNNDLYVIVDASIFANLLDACISVCNFDTKCAFFDYDSTYLFCYLYPSSELPFLTESSGSTVYIKNGSYKSMVGYSASGGTILYSLVFDNAETNPIDAAKMACNADLTCALFDYTIIDGICTFNASDAVSGITINSDYETYIKSGFIYEKKRDL